MGVRVLGCSWVLLCACVWECEVCPAYPPLLAGAYASFGETQGFLTRCRTFRLQVVLRDQTCSLALRKCLVCGQPVLATGASDSHCGLC